MKYMSYSSCRPNPNHPNPRSALPTLLCVLALSLTARARAEAAIVFVDNTNNGSQTLVPPSVSSSLATASRGYSFTTGSNALDLTSITMGVYGNAGGIGNVGLNLYQGANTSGTVLQTLAPTSQTLTTIGTPGNYLNFVVNWSLAANTQYAVAATFSAGGTVTPRLAVSNGAMSLAPGITGGSFFANNGTVSDAYAIQIDGNELSAVPEPSGFILCGLSIGAFALLKVQRNRGKIIEKII